jgi:hypothetical protein
MEQSETIPFTFGARLKITSDTDPVFKVQPTVVGIIGKDAILIRDPVFRKGEIAGKIGEEILCTYADDGCLYKFQSSLKQVLYEGVVGIDYPKKFETQQLRQNRRIKLRLAAESFVGEERKLLNVEVRDISETGCCLELPGLLPLAPGAPLSLTFHLPNDELIEYLESTVMNVRHMDIQKTTHVGVSFSGPNPEIEKIRKLLEMCSYFKV